MKHKNLTTYLCVAALVVATGCSDTNRSAQGSPDQLERTSNSLVQAEWSPDHQPLGDDSPPWLRAAQSGELLQLRDESIIEQTLTLPSLAFFVFTAWSRDQRLAKSDDSAVALLADYSMVNRLPIFEVPFEFHTDSARMVSERFGVRSAPEVVMYFNGKEIGRISFAPPSRDVLLVFEQDIEKILVKAGVSLPDKRVPVTEANHDAFVSGEGTALLFFSAPWCTVCKVYYPNVRNLSVNAPGLRVGVIDIDKSPKLAKERYNVRGIPVFVVLENGVEERRAVGPDADLIFDLYSIGKVRIHDKGN